MPSPKPNALDAARSTLNDLTKERERVDGRLAEIATERERIAHAALTGDGDALEQLQGLKREAADMADHRRDVEAAIAQAERIFKKAWDAESRREEVADANRRKAYAARLRTVGGAADQGQLVELGTIPEEAIAAGVDFLTIERIGPLLMIALHTKLAPLHRFMDVKERRMIRPADRCTFTELLGRWANRIDQEADSVIAGKAPQSRKEAA